MEVHNHTDHQRTEVPNHTDHQGTEAPNHTDHQRTEVPNHTDHQGTEAPNHTAHQGTEAIAQVIYRCKKCRRIVASQENIVTHKRGGGQTCFKWKKRSSNSSETNKEPPECSSIFVEPMKWMQVVEEGRVEEKLQCLGCKGRLGSFNWAGMQCNCGAWVNPAFQLHKNRLDECIL